MTSGQLNKKLRDLDKLLVNRLGYLAEEVNKSDDTEVKKSFFIWVRDFAKFLGTCLETGRGK